MRTRKPLRRSKRSKFGVFDPATQTECAICTMDFETDDDISSPFACGHRFHRDCINAWINRRRANDLRPNCAICKSEVLNSEYSMNLESKLFEVVEPSESREENYDNPPQRPESVPKIYQLFPTERKRQILMD